MSRIVFIVGLLGMLFAFQGLGSEAVGSHVDPGSIQSGHEHVAKSADHHGDNECRSNFEVGSHCQTPCFVASELDDFEHPKACNRPLTSIHTDGKDHFAAQKSPPPKLSL